MKKQQEVRVLAYVCGDEHMRKAYEEDKDIYAWIGSMVYHVPYEECKEFYPDGTTNVEGKKRRTSMKSVVLGQHIRPLCLATSIRKRCEPYYSRVCAKAC